MRRSMRVLVWGALGVMLTCGVACSSSDDVCDDACSKWARCGNWSYGACWDDCKGEGDWSVMYRDCIVNAGCSESALDACDW